MMIRHFSNAARVMNMQITPWMRFCLYQWVVFLFPDPLILNHYQCSFFLSFLFVCSPKTHYFAMAFPTVFCLSLLAAFYASAQSTCTTLQPVFELPLDATSTVYASTITSTSSVDCAGCSLVVSTFRAILSTPVCALPPPSIKYRSKSTDRVSTLGTNAIDHHNPTRNNIRNLHLPTGNTSLDKHLDKLHYPILCSRPYSIASSPCDPSDPGINQ